MNLIIKSEFETQKLAVLFHELIRLPLIVGFQGDLGVGKTAFIRNVIRCYKKNEKVKSPTFGLIEEYNYSGVNIQHVDLYRLNKDEEYLTDVYDFQKEDSLILVEWVENDLRLLKNSDIIVRMSIIDNSNHRKFTFIGLSNAGKQIVNNLHNDSVV